MNIAFLKPPIGGILGLEMLTFVEPLGLICVAGCLEADGHACKVIDLRLEGEEQGLEICRRFAPAVDYRLLNWNRLRAPGRPGFLRSTARGSRVMSPAARSLSRC